MLITKRQLKTYHTASKDDARPVLEHIYLYRDGDKSVAVATDSYVLAEVREPVKSVAEYPEITPGVEHEEIESALLMAGVAKSMVSVLPKKCVLPILSNALLQKGELISTDLDRVTKLGAREYDGKFPDYKKLIPKSAAFQVALDPKKLKQALEIFKDDRKLTIEFGATVMDPVVLRSDSMGTETTVLVMPLKS